MFTRCPQCKTVHPLSAALLSYARGSVRCGQCGKSYDALSYLFDQWPAGQAYRPARSATAAPPVLGQSASNTTAPAEITRADQDSAGQRINPYRWAWGLAMIVLVMLTIANAAWTFREPLMQQPRISAWLESNDWLQPEQQGMVRNPHQIQLTSRDLHSHPTRIGILVLSLTFVNLAQHRQPFPVLEVTLLDASNQWVARRRFQPFEYLRNGADIESGLATDVFLPVLLELGDPGSQAVGFEIQFL